MTHTSAELKTLNSLIATLSSGALTLNNLDGCNHLFEKTLSVLEEYGREKRNEGLDEGRYLILHMVSQCKQKPKDMKELINTAERMKGVYKQEKSNG